MSPKELKKKLSNAQNLKNIAFKSIIKHLFNVSVKKFNLKYKDNLKVLKKIERAMIQVCKKTQKKPIERKRANEAGNAIEGIVIKELEELKIRASRAKSKNNKVQGYPDFKIEREESDPIYLEVKTYNKKNLYSSQRSFYLSPSKDPKVYEDGFHLLVCFEMSRKDNKFTAKSFKIIDLYGLDCDLKSEFNSNNRRLYEKSRILIEGKV